MRKLNLLKSLRSPRGLPQVLVGALLFSVLVAGMWPDLGLNLFAEAIGVVFTILVIQVLLDRRDREAKLPALKAAAKDAAVLANRADGLLGNILTSVVRWEEQSVLINAGSGLADQSLRGFYDRPLTGVACVIDSADFRTHVAWSHCLSAELRDLKTRSDEFLQRFGALADPPLVQAVADLYASPIFSLPVHIFQTHTFGEGWLELAKASQATRRAVREMDVLEPDHPMLTADWLQPVLEKIRHSPTASPEAPYRPPA